MPKSAAQTRELLRLMVAFRELTRDYLESAATSLEDIIGEIPVGGMEEHLEIMLEEANRMRDILNAIEVNVRRFVLSVNMPLGALAGSPAPSQSLAQNISLFNKYLIDSGESVKSASLTRTAFSPAGGNVGNGSVIEVTTGADGIALQAGHNEQITLRAVSIAANRRAAFSIQGSELKLYHFDSNMGTGSNGNGYAFNWGAVSSDFSRETPILFTDDAPEVVSWDGSDSRNMVVNGAFEQELTSGDSKVPGGTFLSGAANVTEEVTTPIAGTRSLEATGDFELEFPCVGDVIGRPEFMTMLYRRRGTITGNLSLIYRSGPSGSPTDHFTETVALGSVTADEILRIARGFVVPTALGDNPRVVIKLASVGGAGSVEFDELVRGVCSLFDSNRAIAVVDGTVKFRIGDLFTGGNDYTWAPDTAFQRNFIELFGRSVRHESSPTFWTV